MNLFKGVSLLMSLAALAVLGACKPISVSPERITLSAGSPTATVAVTTRGGTPSWHSSVVGPASLTVTPAAASGATTSVTVSMTEFLLPHSYYVNFVLEDGRFTQAPLEVRVESVMWMIDVPAASFVMGSPSGPDFSTDENPQHNVALSSYSIGALEVMAGQFADVLNWALERGRLQRPSGGPYRGGEEVWAAGRMVCLLETEAQIPGGIRFEDGRFVVSLYNNIYTAENDPVVNVTWHGALAFCNWLSEKEGLSPAYDLSTWSLISPRTGGYRLPTEAEWERAAGWVAAPVPAHWQYAFEGGVIDAARCNYDNLNPLAQAEPPYITPVRYFSGFFPGTVDAPSPVGCYDMSGNVAEWCWDWYGPYPATDQVDPQGESSGSGRIMRGGSWDVAAISCTTTSRRSYPPESCANYLGFRVAR